MSKKEYYCVIRKKTETGLHGMIATSPKQAERAIKSNDAEPGYLDLAPHWTEDEISAHVEKVKCKVEPWNM